MRPNRKRRTLPACDEIRPLLADLVGLDLGLDGLTQGASDRTSSDIAADLTAIRPHLTHCTDCRGELAAWQALRSDLRGAWIEAQPPALDFAMALLPEEEVGHRRFWFLRAPALLPAGFPWLDGAFPFRGRFAEFAMRPRLAPLLTLLGLGLTATLLGLALSGGGSKLRQAWFASNPTSPAPDERVAPAQDPAARQQAGGPAQATGVARLGSVTDPNRAARGRSELPRDPAPSDGEPPAEPLQAAIDPAHRAQPTLGASVTTSSLLRATIEPPRSPQQQPPSGPQDPQDPQDPPEEPGAPDPTSEPRNPDPTPSQPTTSAPEPTSVAATPTAIPGPATPLPTAVARVAGRVEDRRGLGLAWALVYLRPWPEGAGRFLLTDTSEDGSFVLDLPAGRYRLWVEAEGYEPGWYGGEVADVIDLPPAAERRDLRVRLDPAEGPPLILPSPSPTAQTLPPPISAPDR